MTRVFIGGIMQGSINGKGIVNQDYRSAIRSALQDRWSDVDVIDPYVLHPNSVNYDVDGARSTLFSLVDLAAGSDLVIAYVPLASMGTAMEMYSAYQRGVPVIAISPMAENWVVQVLSRRIYPDLDAFLAEVSRAGRIEELL